MINFLHRWFHPHCEHCHNEMLENKMCNACEVLREEVSRLRLENDRLLDSILKPLVEENEEVKNEEYKPIMPNMVPWRVRKHMLETEDRRKAQLMSEAPKPDINTLEKELLDNA